MSRSSNRGPRADIALLRKLKADPNFSPSSLLNSGPNFLEKANKLKGFVAEQRGKLGASAAKTEWLLAYQQLQGDQDEAERELTTCLQQLADQTGNELRDISEAFAVLQAQAEACRDERSRLRSQAKSLSTEHRHLKASGVPAKSSKEAHALKGNISATSKELETTLSLLTEQAAALSSELRSCWPSCLLEAGPGLGGELGGGGEGGAVLGVDSRAADVEELERMLARYPLAAADIKERIRAVFVALQDKYLERLETWRLETDRSAQELTTGRVAPSTSTSVALTHPPRRSQIPGPNPSLPHPTAKNTTTGGTHTGTKPKGPAARAAPPPPPAPQPPHRTASSAYGGHGGGLATAAAAAPGGTPSSPSELSPVASSYSVLGGGGGGGWVFAGYGGWSAEEHSAFVRHRDRLMKESRQGGKPCSREVLMSRIATLLPGGRTAAEVLAHDDWTTAARLAARKRRDLSGGWERERRQFIEDSASFLQESETLFLVQAEEAADRLVAELLRERAHDELEELRADRVSREEVAAAERLAAEAAEAAARLAAEARERQDRAVQRDMLAAYRAELERQQAERDAAAAAEAAMAAEAAEQQAVYNKERVGVRQAEYVEKQEGIKERQLASEAEAAARAARLARLAALVAPCVEADPERAMAPTAASAAAVDKSEGAFNPVNGYTTDQVLRDQRFKVMEALAAVGLHETDYGRRVIAAARPAKPTRPDNFTTDQREALIRQ